MTIDRKIRARSALALALPLMLLAGCTPNDTGIGNAVHSNNMAQIVDPEPEYADALTANGNQTAAAQDRYVKGTVTKPTRVNTTSGSGSSGSGGGSGSSSGGN